MASKSPFHNVLFIIITKWLSYQSDDHYTCLKIKTGDLSLEH